MNFLSFSQTKLRSSLALRTHSWEGQGQHLFFWRRILLCKIQNSETKKERFKNPPAFLPRPLLRAERKPRRGNSPPKADRHSP